MDAMKSVISAMAAVMLAAPALAGPVGITKGVMEITVPLPDGGSATISRVQDNDHKVEGFWAKTSRVCPPYCIQEYRPAEGVTTIGELELIDMLKDPDVVVIDGRMPPDFEDGSIPGAVNIPYTEASDRLDELGCTEGADDGYDCTNAKQVALFCNGPWCDQSPEAARRMIEYGFPAEKIHFYRGGMQVWHMLGLTVTEAK